MSVGGRMHADLNCSFSQLTISLPRQAFARCGTTALTASRSIETSAADQKQYPDPPRNLQQCRAQEGRQTNRHLPAGSAGAGPSPTLGRSDCPVNPRDFASLFRRRLAGYGRAFRSRSAANARVPGQKTFLLPERRLGDTTYEKRPA